MKRSERAVAEKAKKGVEKKAKATKEEKKRILFVGNSFLNRHNVPKLVAELSPEEIEVELLQKGGASLRRHLNANLAEKLPLFDVVVLQEQSTLPIKNEKRFFENVKEIHSANKSNSAIVLFSTWPKLDEPHNGAVLHDAYHRIASEVSAAVAPVGQAFTEYTAGPKSELYDKDGIHASAKGAQLAAQILVQTIFSME
jgi:lysophospholipase L1-like esterase